MKSKLIKAKTLELPSKEDVILTDAQGNPTTVKAMSNEGVTGNYRSSEAVTGENVWGTRAKWMDLYGSIGDEKISLVICDHPRNLSYPTLRYRIIISSGAHLTDAEINAYADDFNRKYN